MWLTALMVVALGLGESAAAPSRAVDLTLTGILGIEIGTPVADARRILDASGDGNRRGTRDGGSKEAWTFATGPYDWIALRAGSDGRVRWITGRRRAGSEVPFGALPTPPDVATDAIAIWHVTGAIAPARLTLRGTAGRAQVVTLLAVP